jgi:cell division septum initiation protein DivIVA
MTDTRPDEGGTPDPVPDDPQALREEIQQTRKDLGDTVEALAAKADVRARTREKAADVKAQAKDKAAETADRVQAKASELKEQAAAVAQKVTEATPEPARQAAAQAASTVRQWRGPILAAAAFVLLAGWRRGRKRRRR